MPEEKKWITINGTAVPLDENGNLEGKVGNKIEKQKTSNVLTPYQKPAKSFSEYLKENGNDKEKAAYQFFKDNLQDRSVQTKINGIEADILFTGGTWREFKQCIGSQKHYKAEFLEDVPDVLQHYKDKGGLKHSSNVFSDFHYFENTIEKEINGKPVKAKVSVDVGTRKDDKTLQAHSYFVSTDSAIEKGKSHDEHWRITHYQSNEHRKGLPPRLSSMAFDKNIRPQYEIVNIEIDILEDEPMNKRTVIFDSKSKRSFDINGFMHVELSNLTKESVDPYWGYEIVNSEALGLEQDKLYYGYRKGEELKKAAQTFNGLPLMRDHHFDSAEKPQREFRVGSVGTDCVYNAPYLQASLTITDAEAIRKIESGERVELSCSYFYTTVLEKGEFNGQPYDFIMTEIQGNHVALVEEGRAGADVRVADSGKAVQDALKPRSGSEAKTTLFASDSECQEGRLTERCSKAEGRVGADVRVADSGENVKETQENIQPLTQKENNMAQLEPKENQTENNEIVKDNETQEKACDADLGEQEKAAAQDEDDFEIEEILQAAGIAPSDEVKKAFLAGMHFSRKKDEAKEASSLDNELPCEKKEKSRGEIYLIKKSANCFSVFIDKNS